ncbi:antirestriction protein ArdA [Lactococcus insecticola]|uniref:Uncharacterized protein n=1 Tax=Pseudolactococcus insecticola TaxID=2709158 RepID=A0A6A0B8P3_9LACT|nr:antirestriction protein ArdA [Lactococcus insecticola]GFH40801.1 hypothetical protein Hs20B_11990 [Lactococcus insecticola]
MNTEEMIDELPKYISKNVDELLGIFGTKEMLLEHWKSDLVLYQGIDNDWDLGVYVFENYPEIKDVQIGWNFLSEYIDFQALGRDVEMNGYGFYVDEGFLKYVGGGLEW